MKIDYVGRHYRLDDEIRRFTEDKLGKVSKFVEDPVEVRVSLEHNDHRNRNIAEIHISHRRGVIQATEEAADMHDAINAAVDKAEKQARRGRKKLRESWRKGKSNGSRWPLDILEADSVASGDTPRIVRSTHLEIKPMSIDEAALQLDGSNYEFLVFREAASEQVSVLYKRKDQNYGLISPKP